MHTDKIGPPKRDVLEHGERFNSRELSALRRLDKQSRFASPHRLHGVDVLLHNVSTAIYLQTLLCVMHPGMMCLCV
jgi:hypothetical protein